MLLILRYRCGSPSYEKKLYRSPVSYARASTNRVLFKRRNHHSFRRFYLKRKLQLQLYFVMRLIVCGSYSENAHPIESLRAHRKTRRLPDRFLNEQTIELIDKSWQKPCIYVSEHRSKDFRCI